MKSFQLLPLIVVFASCPLYGMEGKETKEHKAQATTSSSLTHDQDWSHYLQLIKGQIAASESNSSKKAAISNIVLKIAKQCKVDPETLLLSWDVATRTLFFAETLANTLCNLEHELAYYSCWITHMHSIPTTKENFLETTRITVQYLLSKFAYQAITQHLLLTLIMAATEQPRNPTYQEEYDCIVSTIFEAQCMLEQNIVQESEHHVRFSFVLIGGLSDQPSYVNNFSGSLKLPLYALKKVYEVIHTEHRLSVLSPKELWLRYVQYKQGKRTVSPEEPSLSRLRKDMVYRGLESYKVDPTTVMVITNKYLVGPRKTDCLSGHCDTDYRIIWLDAGGDSPVLRALVLYAAYHEIGHLVDESAKKIEEAGKAGKAQELVCARQCELRADLFAVEHLLHDECYDSVIKHLATLIVHSTKGLDRSFRYHPTFEEEYENIVNYLQNHDYDVLLSYLPDNSALLNLMKKNQSKPLALASTGLKKADIDTLENKRMYNAVNRALKNFKIDPRSIRIVIYDEASAFKSTGPNTIFIMRNLCKNAAALNFIAHNQVAHLFDLQLDHEHDAFATENLVIKSLIQEKEYGVLLGGFITIVTTMLKGRDHIIQSAHSVQQEMKNMILTLKKLGYSIKITHQKHGISVTYISLMQGDNEITTVMVPYNVEFDSAGIDEIKEQTESKASASSLSCTVSTAQAIASSSAQSILATTSLQTDVQNAAIAPIMGEFKENEYASKACLTDFAHPCMGSYLQ